MNTNDLKEFRQKLFAYEHDHQEIRKVPVPQCKQCRVVPNTREAKLYWHLRNATKGIMRKYANVTETAKCQLGQAYSPTPLDLEPDEERLLIKWQKEFEQLPF